jgi:hypothetical protein
MKTILSGAARWLPTIANLAVLGGVLLVAFQLQQSADLARVALINERTATETALWIELMNTDVSEVIAKSEVCPEQLTPADYVILDSYLYTAVNNLFNNYEIAREGLFTQSDWKSEVDNYAYWYLGGTFGRTYWDNVGKHFFPAEFTDYVDLQIAKGGSDVSDAWQTITSKLSPGSSPRQPTSAGCRPLHQKQDVAREQVD